MTLEPPSDPYHASSFLNIRVADIGAVYEQWSARGAEFLTPPIDRGNEIRCYIRDPDGHLIEVANWWAHRGLIAPSRNAVVFDCPTERDVEALVR